ncbi:uncharacterized protein BP5553_08859 [Venustampulla echinocandica]|uniref:ABC transporter domain-containing protein n=1 Tax=Venustampulla echinocandica TaxID=2656787 RepID=A0A370TD60_9HELO|nr:uncharacterized protein BP5553_08859 [Venustampulla echinocandica]RDL32403.1 hypothetical protein BP5553_08859 [Venustampulla echinocandica]
MLDIQHQDPEWFAPRSSGIAFNNLNAHGYGVATDYQTSVVNIFLETVGWVRRMAGAEKPRRIDILRDLPGIIKSGEMLVILGPPGSGCSTFLKTIAGESRGISPELMHHHFRREAIYTSEVDVHFPMLFVGDTLTLAARARAPQFMPGDVNIDVYANHTRDAVMAMFGVGHTIDTRVGDDYIRGVSGGERKRVTIAEAVLSGAPLQCWDNSTRGLDSANAIEFFFDKVIVLFEGRQIYFGYTTTAKAYFVNMGFECPDRQTAADFLTSMTSSRERVSRPGFAGRVPCTPDEFAQAW